MAILFLAANPPMLPAAQPRIVVDDVEELYEVVNNPANTGVRVELRAGTYTLTTLDEFGAPRPNGGTLLLQPGMDLCGEQEYFDWDRDGVWDPIPGFDEDTYVIAGTETTIEADELILEVFSVSDCYDPPNVRGGFTAPVVQYGRRNRVERLTIRDETGVSSVPARRKLLVAPPFDCSLALGGGWESEVADCVLEGGWRGATVMNVGCGAVGFGSSGTFERNVVRYNRGGIYASTFITGNPESWGSSIDVMLWNNRVYDNGGDSGFGFIAGGNGSDNSELHVLSFGNILERNALGVRITGGSDNNMTGSGSGSNGNRIWFASYDDTIVDSGPRGGLIVHASHRTRLEAEPSSNNLVRLNLIGTRVERNVQVANGASQPVDILLMGGLGARGILLPILGITFFPGDNNVVEALLRDVQGDGTPGAFRVIDSYVPEPSNRVILRGSNVAFDRTTDGLFATGTILNDD